MGLCNLEVGQVVIYSDEHETHLWYPGNCAVAVYSAWTGNEVDVYNWCEAPKDIDDAVAKAKQHMDLLDEEDDEEAEQQDWNGWMEEMGGFNPLNN